MSYFARVQLKDQYGFAVECTPMDELRVVEPVRLVGSTFVGTTVDSQFWVTTGTGGTTGTATQANGALTLATGTNAAGAAVIQSYRKARYIGASANRFRAQIQLSAGVTNNVRKWGMFDGQTGAPGTATNGAYFKLDGTTLSVCTLKDGAETPVASTAWNGDTTTPTITNVNSYEIYTTNAKVYFIIGGVLKHTASFPTSTWTQTITLPARASSINAGSTTDCTILIRVMTISRLGKMETLPTSFNGTTASALLKRGPGNLHRIILNNVVSAYTLTIADAVSGTSPALATITVGTKAVAPTSIEYHLPFATGLYVTVGGTTTGADWTIVYE